MEEETPLQDERPLNDAGKAPGEQEVSSTDKASSLDSAEEKAEASEIGLKTEASETVVSGPDMRPNAKDETIAGAPRLVEAHRA